MKKVLGFIPITSTAAEKFFFVNSWAVLSAQIQELSRSILVLDVPEENRVWNDAPGELGAE